MSSFVELSTERLRLTRPTLDDVDPLHVISSDPKVWLHFPSLRPTERDQTRAMVERWQAGWDAAGLGMWTVRLRDEGRVIGYGGCGLRLDAFWNLGYRLAAAEHGRGYATEVSRAGVAAVRELDPDRPIVAFLVEHNTASAKVAEKVGLRLAHRAPDVGNPDPQVMRLVYADRDLSDAQLAAALA